MLSTEHKRELAVPLSKYCCVICNKTYSRKTSLDKHTILCDFKLKSSSEREIDFEELGDIPNHLQLVKIMQELTFKYIKMQEQLEQMKQWVDKKKKKLNIVSWLNSNKMPTVGFLEWVNTCLVVNRKHFESLMENTLFKTIQQVFEYNLTETNDFIYPISCFSQKANTFYICEKNADNIPEWKQMALTDMVLLLKTVQHRMIRELSKWKAENQSNFEDNDKMSELFNKAVIKLMNLSFTQDMSMSRIRNSLYTYLKTDLKTLIECEFD
jgi:hypothetical protein